MDRPSEPDRTALRLAERLIQLLDRGGFTATYKYAVLIAIMDHFVPWSRHADNSIDNLVAACSKCNGRKSDYLAAADHVKRWRERSARHETDLAAIARDETWESQPTRTFSVARAIYRMLPDDARLWHAGQKFVLIERPRISLALAA